MIDDSADASRLVTSARILSPLEDQELRERKARKHAADVRLAWLLRGVLVAMGLFALACKVLL